MDSVTATIARLRLIPVVTLERASDSRALGQALKTGGLPCAEVTFRTEAAEEAIRILAQDSDMLIGAGTVLHIEQVDRAIDAGARYIVTPGFSPRIVGHCLERGVVVYPGVVTPTEIQIALEHGVTVLKFFPAEACGGVRALEALSAPFSMVQFIPTGGITPTNFRGYLDHNSVIAVGGSWMVARDLIATANFDEIRRRTAAAVEALG